MRPCLRCRMPVSEGACAPEPHVFHNKAEDCAKALRAALDEAEKERGPLTEYEWSQLRALANGWPYPTVGVTEDEEQEIRKGLEVLKTHEYGRLAMRRVLAHVDVAESREARLREAAMSANDRWMLAEVALAFYASPDSYRATWIPGAGKETTPVQEDGGERARHALKGSG